MRPHAIWIVYRRAWWSMERDCPRALCWRPTAAEAEEVAAELQTRYVRGQVAKGYSPTWANRPLYFYRELTDELPEDACP